MANCSLINDSTAVAPDPDIVGWGATIGFIFTTVLSFLTLFVAYWTDSLPDELPQPQLWLQIKEANGEETRVSRATAARRGRIEAFQKFLLALSDQQLAMGSSILIAGFGRYEDVTTYSINIVIDLAYLTACVHLVTLPVLEPQMRGSKFLKGVRTFFMLSSLILLLFLMVTQLSWYSDYHDQYVFYSCVLPNWNQIYWWPQDLYTIVPSVQVMLLLVVSYTDGLVTLWSDNYTSIHALSLRSWLRFNRVGDDQFLQHISKAQACDIYNAPTGIRGLRVFAYQQSEKWAFRHACASIEYEMIWLLFTVVFGVAQTFFDRSELSGAVLNQMGFGQIVPLILLVVPLMTAIQAYYDYRESLEKESSSAHTSSRSSVELSNLDLDHSSRLSEPANIEDAHDLLATTATDNLYATSRQLKMLNSSETRSSATEDLSSLLGRRPSLFLRRYHPSMANSQIIPPIHRTGTLELPSPTQQQLQRVNSIPAALAGWYVPGNTLAKRTVQDIAWWWIYTVSILAIPAGYFTAAGGESYWILTAILSVIVLRSMYFSLWCFWQARIIRCRE